MALAVPPLTPSSPGTRTRSQVGADAPGESLGFKADGLQSAVQTLLEARIFLDIPFIVC